MKKIREGFPDQRLRRMPQELCERSAKLPIVGDLYVTDLGHFPKSAHHHVSRPEGAAQHIVILCLSGQGWVRLGKNKRMSVPPQCVLSIPAGTPHAYGAQSEVPWRLVWVHFTGIRSLEYMKLLRGEAEASIMRISGVDVLMEAFESLWMAQDDGDSDTGLLNMTSALVRFLVLLQVHRKVYGLKMQDSGDRVLRTITWMREHLEESVTLKKLASVAGISVPHYCALFKEQTGISPMQYFTRMRMRWAAELLDRTTDTVTEISLRLNYENPYHFSRVFRNVQGVSPRAYRNQLKG
jgi:AraC family transcriptional regulator, arabinose operon regulatory protein